VVNPEDPERVVEELELTPSQVWNIIFSSATSMKDRNVHVSIPALRESVSICGLELFMTMDFA